MDDSSKPKSLPPNVADVVNCVAFVDTLFGQLFFGWLGDKLGWNWVYSMTLVLMDMAMIACDLSFGSESMNVIATSCFFHFWLRFSIGGDYCLPATIMSKYANKKTHGAFIVVVFALQGFGILGGGVIAIIVSSTFNHFYDAPPYKVDPIGSIVPQAGDVWRLILI